MSDTHGKFIWCELMTPDPDAAKKFYGSVIGWTSSPMPAEDQPQYSIFEANGVPSVGMMPFPAELEGQGIPPNWTAYLCVDDVDQTAKDYEANGGTVRRPPADIPGIGRFAVVADPQGAVLCIMTPIPPETPRPEVPVGTPGHIGWYELYATDGAKAFDFYSKLFGWTKDQDFDMGPMGVYHIFAEHGKQTGGMMTRPPEIKMSFWTYYFTVPALDAAIDRINAGGGKVVNGPMEVPGSWVCQAMDPQGAFFCLSAEKR
ncbi:VOC family protein [Rhizobium viscosum]|uniref:Enzyme related to lactoylglutathione lyase n=1 Tax=Rhizobium viscosum TaxID=1673 RepID=A0ABR9IKJ2_RHIVS|nr:VOC family protein [Rhizobium viscosum]MBE1503706.1 putative enzyme related to lactoylglutathione lyase [Rhizobium viscosum]